jgi:cell division protein FtsB
LKEDNKELRKNSLARREALTRDKSHDNVYTPKTPEGSGSDKKKGEIMHEIFPGRTPMESPSSLPSSNSSQDSLSRCDSSSGFPFPPVSKSASPSSPNPSRRLSLGRRWSSAAELSTSTILISDPLTGTIERLRKQKKQLSDDNKSLKRRIKELENKSPESRPELISRSPVEDVFVIYVPVAEPTTESEDLAKLREENERLAADNEEKNRKIAELEKKTNLTLSQLISDKGQLKLIELLANKLLERLAEIEDLEQRLEHGDFDDKDFN